MGVMNTKLGVNAFGATPGTSAPKSNPVNTVSALDKDKIGGDNVGDVLNKIADPNWVDPSKKMRTAGNPNLDKDAFFKLMIAQMKNQDPTNPLKSHEMAAQLANFSSLEQMQNMNSTLTEMKNGQKPVENYQALNLIGKAVAGDSGKLVRANGDRDHEFRFSLPMDVSEATIKVRNSDGEVVRTYDLKGLKKGDNKITWNGDDEKGTKMPPGEYDFFAEAKDAAGKKIAVKTDFDGIITGVNYTPEGPVLLVGNQTIRMRDVKKITDPGLKNYDQKINDVTSLDLKKDVAAGETGKEGNVESHKASKVSPESAPVAKSKIMDNVGLSRDMMEKLAKETAPEPTQQVAMKENKK